MTAERPHPCDPEPIIEEFESALRRGELPDIGSFVAARGGDFATLIELVHVDLEFRLKAGKTARVEEYLYVYPQLRSHSAALLDLLVAEFEFRSRTDPALQSREYEQRFPALIHELRRRLPAAPIPVTAPFLPPLLRAPRRPLRWHDYHILEERGRGVGSVVYAARQSYSGRMVALKLFLDSGITEKEVLRWRALADTLSQLAHPQVVSFHDVGGFPSEGATQFYVTMELLEGGSLAQRLQSAPLSLHASLQLLTSLARTLHAVHSKGVVHGALKPSNILFAGGQAATPVPMLADFGIARHLLRTAAVTSRTLRYLAPEHFASEGKIGPASDLYALGVLLYEVLTGTVPFPATGNLALTQQILEDEPLPPSRHQSAVPPAVERICLRCLRKDPRQRYSTASALVDELDRVVRQLPPAAC